MTDPLGVSQVRKEKDQERYTRVDGESCKRGTGSTASTD